MWGIGRRRPSSTGYAISSIGSGTIIASAKGLRCPPTALRLSCAKNYRKVIQLVSRIGELFVHGTGVLVGTRAFDGGDGDIHPAVPFEYFFVLIRSHPIGYAAEPECPVDRIRISIDIVGILVADPARMSFQIDFGNDDRPRLPHHTQLLHGADDVVDMFERSLAEHQVDAVGAERGDEVEVAAHHHTKVRRR